MSSVWDVGGRYPQEGKNETNSRNQAPGYMDRGPLPQLSSGRVGLMRDTWSCGADNQADRGWAGGLMGQELEEHLGPPKVTCRDRSSAPLASGSSKGAKEA